MANSLPLQVAETVQTVHIQRNPSPEHDLNPSTAASKKQPVKLGEKVSNHEELDESDDDELPYHVMVSKPRGHRFPPMPDLRYEQSYLHSIRNASTWWRVGLITARDQVRRQRQMWPATNPQADQYLKVVMPLVQGVVYNIAIVGWQYWNRTAQYSGSSIGARLRRWWWGVNNWPIP